VVALAQQRKANAIDAVPAQDAGVSTESGIAGAAMTPAAPAPLQEASERQATVDAGTFSASFKIAGRSSLGSDGTVKTAPISTLSARRRTVAEPRALLRF
jgi:hypothetical protein